MKKLIGFCFVLLIGIGIFSAQKIMTTFAAENVYFETIAEDTSYTNRTFNIDTSNGVNNGFNIESGVLKLTDCTIDAGNSTITNLFNVNSGAKLILENVKIQNVIYSYGIYNKGTVEITNTDFLDCGNAIYNDSTENNSIVYNSGKLKKVQLKYGYISVNANTFINENINISVLSNSDYTYSGKVVVKGVGQNVFANKFIKFFKYTNPTYYLDYIGDFDSSTITVKDPKTNTQLQSGDIILAQQTLTFNDEVTLYSALYCTCDKFMTENYTLYYGNTYARMMDNYSANTIDGSARFTKRGESSQDNPILNTLNIKCYYEGESEPFSSTKQYYLSGSNHAFFVDIPKGYEYNDNYEISVKGTTDIIVDLYDNVCSNGSYMRPIVEYKTTNYTSLDVNVNFTFTRIEQKTTINVINENPSIQVLIEDEELTDKQFVVGEEYTFNIPFVEGVEVTDIQYNGTEVEILENTEGYYFTLTIVESGSLVITSAVIPATSTIDVSKDNDNIQVLYENENINTIEFVVGNEYTFEIPFIENLEITSVKFNNVDVDVIKGSESYNFTLTIAEINYIVIVSEIIPQTATISINKDNNIEIIYDSKTIEGVEFEIGREYEFVIAFSEEFKITTITFNDENVEFTKEENGYIFSLVIEEINNLVVESEDLPKVSTIQVINNDKDVSVLYQDQSINGVEFVIGNEYTFSLTYENVKVLSATFNASIITLTKNNSIYTFTITIAETNVIEINALSLPISIIVTPDPEKTTFEYGENVVLTESYYVEETKETITINYTPDSNTNYGTYKITNATCNNDDYVILIAEGDYTYTITKKIITVSVIDVQDVTIEYSKNLTLDENMFITYIPNYLSAELDLEEFEVVPGLNTLKMDIRVLNENYKLEGNNFISVNLYITPSTISANNAKFLDYTTSYTGEPITISVTDYDSSLINITYSYKLISGEIKTPVEEAINSGEYEVIAMFVAKSSLFVIEKEMVAKLTINKVEIDLSEYTQAVAEFEFGYDGNKHSIDLKENKLPDEVQIDDNNIENYAQVNAGIYNIVIPLLFDKVNYICLESVPSKLIIKPKLITISLVQNSFDYTGSVPILEASHSGVISGDIVNITLEMPTGVNADTYEISVVSIDNTNYTFDETLKLSYTINGIRVDMSSVVFSNVNAIYNGQPHFPQLNGQLPSGIKSKIDETAECINVGIYVVKCEFEVTNNNYLVPEPMYATSTINKCPLYATFSEQEDMNYDGQKKSISVDFSGIIEGDNINYEITYSKDPILSGTYTCRVMLIDEMNYYIANSNQYEFVIFSGVSTYVGKDLSLTIEGKFSNDNEIAVENITKDLRVVNAIASIDVKSYEGYNISFVSYSSDPVKLNVVASDVVSDTKYLKVYRLVGNTLEEVEFSLSNNTISFYGTNDDNIIFVETHSNLYHHRGLIITASIIAGLLLICGVSFCIVVLVKRHKKNK